MTIQQLRAALDDATGGAAAWAVKLEPDAICHVRLGDQTRPATRITVEFVAGRWVPVIHAAGLGWQDTA